MNCAEAVNSTVILWKSCENRGVTAARALWVEDSGHPRWSAQIRTENAPQKQMRPGPAIRAASFVDLSSCLPAARNSGTTVLVRQRSQVLGVPHLPVLAAEPWFWESPLCNPCAGQRPNLLQERAVEEAAMPGQPIRARARFQFPLAIHPRELPAATGVTAIIIRQAREFSTYRW